MKWAFLLFLLHNTLIQIVSSSLLKLFLLYFFFPFIFFFRNEKTDIHGLSSSQFFFTVFIRIHNKNNEFIHLSFYPNLLGPLVETKSPERGEERKYFLKFVVLFHLFFIPTFPSFSFLSVGVLGDLSL